MDGRRAWHQIQATNPDKITITRKITDLHTRTRKLIKCYTNTTVHPTSTTYGAILRQASATGSDHTIHAFCTSPYRARRDSLEVVWGVHIHGCNRKHGPHLTCTKYRSPLTNTHIVRGCMSTAKLRAKRHNGTFTLLRQRIQSTNGGRWPILGMYLGHKPIIDLKNIHIPLDDTQNLSLRPVHQPSEEGLQDDKTNTPDNPHILPDYILHPNYKPQHRRLDLVRAVVYTFDLQKPEERPHLQGTLPNTNPIMQALNERQQTHYHRSHIQHIRTA